MSSSPWRKSIVAPRTARRPADKARRPRISGIFEEGATPPAGMHRRSNADGVAPRAATARPFLMLGFGAIAIAAVAAGPLPTFTDVTAQAGIRFVHNSGAFGRKYLPETMGSGAVWFDADGDGWQDLLLINSKNWPGHPGPPSLPALYRNT